MMEEIRPFSRCSRPLSWHVLPLPADPSKIIIRTLWAHDFSNTRDQNLVETRPFLLFQIPLFSVSEAPPAGTRINACVAKRDSNNVDNNISWIPWNRSDWLDTLQISIPSWPVQVPLFWPALSPPARTNIHMETYISCLTVNSISMYWSIKISDHDDSLGVKSRLIIILQPVRPAQSLWKCQWVWSLFQSGYTNHPAPGCTFFAKSQCWPGWRWPAGIVRLCSGLLLNAQHSRCYCMHADRDEGGHVGIACLDGGLAAAARLDLELATPHAELERLVCGLV